MLSQRLDWVQGQCALLAGYGIQGDVLANVLYKSGTLIMVPRTNLGLRLKYLYGELGCTPEVSCHALPAVASPVASPLNVPAQPVHSDWPFKVRSLPCM